MRVSRVIEKLRGCRDGVLYANGTVFPIEIGSISQYLYDPAKIEVMIAEGNRGRYIEDNFRREISQLTTRTYLLREKFGMNSEKLTIEKVIFNDPATIVYWSDNTRTVVKCQDGDTYSKEQGLAMCIAKKYLGNKGNFNEVFKKYIGDEYTHNPCKKTISEMRRDLTEYCRGHNCDDCKVDEVIPNCGAGLHPKFENPDHTGYIKSREIKRAHRNVFSKEV